jgi:hypothetical protein
MPSSQPAAAAAPNPISEGVSSRKRKETADAPSVPVSGVRKAQAVASLTPLFIMDVDGIQICIFEGDDPHTVARQHCHKYNMAFFLEELTRYGSVKGGKRAAECALRLFYNMSTAFVLFLCAD